MSPPTPPLPQISPTSLPSLPTASPPSYPQQQTPAANPVANRQILEPVSILKRAAQNSAESNLENQDDEQVEAYSYLPRELAEICMKRQRQERSWKIRLMVCTSFYSCIEGTVASFQEGEEKEVARKIQAYLGAAISQFASADSTPSLPGPLPQSSPIGAKINKTTGQTMNSVLPSTSPLTSVVNKEPAIKTPINVALPNKPQESQSSWVTVARNGHKKARAIPGPEKPTERTKHPLQPLAQKAPIPSKKSPSGIKQPSTSNQDQRLFIRLSDDHDWRKLSPTGIREIIVRKLFVSPTSIGAIKPVRSGFALSPSNNEARTALLNAAIRLASYGAKLESASNWVPVIIPTVPKSIKTLEGCIEISKEILADEIERVTSLRPASIKLYGRNCSEAPHRTWMAFFEKAPRSGFRVFDESGVVRAFKKQQKRIFCKRCNGHHCPKNCSRAPSCGNCGSTMHSEDTCMAMTKCRNCGGPHRSDSRKCLARPTRSGFPTKEQLQSYRQAGDREYQAVVRAKAGEEKAAAAESELTSLNNTTTSESTSDKTPVSSVEASTDDAIRL